MKNPRQRPAPRPLRLEALEARCLLSTFTVLNTNDSGAGSLRQALTDANAMANSLNPGGVPDRIEFAIPGAGVHAIRPTSSLPTITDPVVLDGYSQPGASTNSLAVGNNAVLRIELDGTNAGVPGFGLVITAGSSTVRGLVINRFGNVGISLETNGDNVIEGNWIGTNAAGTDAANNFRGIGTLNGSGRNTIGGTAAPARNVIAGNLTAGIHLATSNNIVQGNYLGTNPAGTAMLSAAVSSGRGVQIDSASTNTIGGVAAGAGNVIAGLSSGIHVFSSTSPSSGNVFQGNFLGTNAAGTAALRNLTGIVLGDTFNGVNNTTIGGTAAGAGNLVSGNNVGITLNLGTGNLIQGNRIGTAADGTTALANALHGIEVRGGTNHTIGRTAPGAGNLIAFNGGAGFEGNGVFVAFGSFIPNPSGVSILGNTIHSNANLGIDLGSGGVTPNDPGDGDTGPNGLQNFPVLTQILASATQTAVQGTLNSTVGGTFRIEFFANAFPGARSHGEGVTFLNAVTVTDGGPGDTDPAAGSVSFQFTAPGDFRGQYLSMTATNLATNDTSEFSLAYPVTTFVVTNTAENGVSFAGPIPGSLRAAIVHANQVPAVDRDGLPGVETDQITFNIPGGGVQTIRLTNTALPNITAPVIIDGTTQPGARPNTNSIDQGANAILTVELVGLGGFSFDGLTITGGGSTVRGLVMNRFGAAILLQNVGGNRVVGNYLGTDAAGSAAPGFGNFRSVQIRNDVNPATNVSNTIGGTSPADRNVIGAGAGNNNGTGIDAAGTSDLTVQGNFIGTDATGTSAHSLGAALELNRVTDSLIGGLDPQARNVIVASGGGIGLSNSQRVTVQGNYLGTDRTGTVGLVNSLGSPSAIRAFISSDNLIGGTVPGAGNVISNYGFGIELGLASPRNTVQGNRIGTDVSGTLNLGNRFAGIRLEDDDSLIGGTVVGAGNTIAFSGTGIAVAGTAQRIAIQGNSIFGNSDLDIDLLITNSVGFGPTPNDAGDADTGGNDLQNFPVLTSLAGNVVSATLNSTASTTFRVEFFAGAAANPSGFGAGRTFLGFVNVTTDATGNTGTFTFTSPTSLAGQFVSATTTDPNGSTSEFSAVLPNAVAPDCVVTNTNDSGPGSLRAAIDCANMTPGLDTITFNIPGTGVHTITPLTALPALTEPAIIDGTTQPGWSANTNGNTLGTNAVLLIEINGTGAGASDGLRLPSGSTVRGLVINRFARSGIVLAGADNVVEGNFLGTDATGAVDLGNALHGVSITGNDRNRVGGPTAPARNLISGNAEHGVSILGAAGDTLVQGNLIGTNAAGTAALGNGHNGVHIDGDESANNRIDGNLISGNSVDGIRITAEASGNLVRGNFIGTDVTGTLDLGNRGTGVSLINTSNNTIISNIVAFNADASGTTGVVVASGSGNTISSNSIFANSGLGINLAGPNDVAFGITPNDNGDLDAGPNNLQNFPVLGSVFDLENGTFRADGEYFSTPNTTFTIELFENVEQDPSGVGEGQRFVDRFTLTTGADGRATFSRTIPNSGGQFISATATDPAGNTSEFSPSLFPTNFNDIGVSALVGPATAVLGAELTYTITVETESDTSNVTDLVLTTAVPANTTFVSFTAPTGFTVVAPAPGSTGAVTAGAPEVSQDSTLTFTLVVRVNPGVADGTTLQVTASVDAATGDRNPDNDSATATTLVRVVGEPGLGQIRGVVFLDYNANGIQDAIDPSLPGRLTFLDANEDGAPGTGEATSRTDGAGRLEFLNLAAGAYTVRQEFDPDHGVVRTSPARLPETLGSGADLAGRNFGNVFISQVSPVEITAVIFPPSPDAATAFVRGLYRNLLGRDAEAFGLAFWVARLQAGGSDQASRAGVTAGVWNSVEHRGLQVDHYYATFLRRLAEPEGRAHHVQRFLSGAGEVDVVFGFVLSREYQNTYPDADSYVGAAYADALSRNAEAFGLAFWANDLRSGARDRANVAFGIVNSDESYLRAVDGYYAAFLHRPGEEAGRQHWLNELRSGRSAAADRPPNSYREVGQKFLHGGVALAEYFATASA